MRIIQINTFPYKATGAIMMGIHQLLVRDGDESYVAWGRGRDSQNEHEISMKDDFGVKFHGVYLITSGICGLMRSWGLC